MMPGFFLPVAGLKPTLLAILFFLVADIDPEEAWKYAQYPEVFILDVREFPEYAEGHIPGACLMPWNSGELQTRWRELPRDRVILVYCRSGARSARAVRFLNERGFGGLLNLLGGFRSYQDLPGVEVETGPYSKSGSGFEDWPLY